MLRRDLQILARTRLREARKLFSLREWSGSYHLCGIAVECALKAAIAKKTQRFEFPDKRYATDCFEHDPHKLLKVSGLEPLLNAETVTSPALALNWAIVKDWGVNSRYDHAVPESKARDMLSAVAARRHGVLKWLRQHW